MSRRTIGVLTTAATLVLVHAGNAQAQANPSAADSKNASNNPCTDPWISLAVSVVKTSNAGPGRASGSGAADECAPRLYNGGKWSSYAELVQAVRAHKQALASANLMWAMDGGAPAIKVIDMSRDVAGQPAKIVASGGGNIVASGGGNIVASGGGNIVASGGGNYKTLSVGEKLRIPLAGGMVLVIRK